ncbi:MAG: ABC transporter substrate-binding protein [Mesorhizobium sp.]|nr:ABC transporter substrate-binding protein [Mesorhizobium sp.]
MGKLRSADDLTRRKFIAGVGVLGTAAIAGSMPALAETELEETAFEIAAVRDPQIGTQLIVADALGLLKEQGLNISIRWLQTAADTIPLMAGRAVPLALGNTFAQVVLGDRIKTVKTISQLADISGNQGFALAPGVKLNSPKELEGKRVAFTQGTPQVLILTKLAKIYGFDAAKVALVNMNQSEGVVAASKGDVDGLLGWQPNLQRLVELGGSLYCTLTTVYASGKPEPMPPGDPLTFQSVLLAQQDWIENRPNTLKAFLTALVKANVVLTTDRGRVFEDIQKVLRIEPKLLALMLDANRFELGIPENLATSYKVLSDWAKSINKISGEVPPSSILSAGIARSVDPALVTWRG